VRISYGKLRVPVHRISGDEVLACEVSIEVLGDNFAPAYTEGDNSNVVATDTMKNFILRESLAYDGGSLEGLLVHLGRRFTATYPVMEGARMSAKELRFDRLGERVYARSADDHGVATVEPDGTVRGGRHGMMLLKTASPPNPSASAGRRRPCSRRRAASRRRSSRSSPPRLSAGWCAPIPPTSRRA